jgi:hypothetical protein
MNETGDLSSHILVIAIIALYGPLLGSWSQLLRRGDDKVTRKDAPTIQRTGGIDNISPFSTSLNTIREIDRDFDEAAFLDGAKNAYEVVLKTFADGDLETLKRFVAVDVLDVFARAIAKRKDRQEVLQLTFIGINNIGRTNRSIFLPQWWRVPCSSTASANFATGHSKTSFMALPARTCSSTSSSTGTTCIPGRHSLISIAMASPPRRRWSSISHSSSPPSAIMLFVSSRTDALTPAKRRDRFLATQPFQHDADLLFRPILLARRPADALDHRLRRQLLCPGFLSHLAPLKGYDEPEILPSQLSRLCLMGADGDK